LLCCSCCSCSCDITQNTASLSNFTMLSAYCTLALPSSLARQPCPAALPGSLARKPCPAASIAWQPCRNITRLITGLRVASRSFVRQNCKLFYGRRPSSSVAYFYLPALVQVFPAILSLVYKLIRERG
jgi:hypothetical protein